MVNPIGNNIRTLRKQLHITQAQLAELCDVEPSNISHWENGRWQPNISHLTTLAAALHVSVEELCGMPLDEEKKVKTRLQNQMIIESEDLTIPEQEYIIDMIKGLKVLRRLNSNQEKYNTLT